AQVAALADKPAWGYAYQYQLPADCIAVRALNVSDPLVNSAAPIVAQTFLGMFRLEGILLLIVGAIGIASWAKARRAQPER
ncbi:MAG: hypothetical protein RIQ88_353, partial [Actinomycetota bacterium]